MPGTDPRQRIGREADQAGRVRMSPSLSRGGKFSTCRTQQAGILLPRRDDEGLPVPREPAYADKRSQDGEAPAASE